MDLTPKVIQAKFTRSLNSTSSADLTLTQCFEECRVVEAWRHEIAFYDGSGYLAWVGPIVGVTRDFDVMAIQARDLSTWLERRFVHDTVPFDSATRLEWDSVEVTRDAIVSALNPDPTNMGLMVHPSGVMVERVIKESDYVQSMSVVNDFASGGGMWTVVGRAMRLGIDEDSEPILGPFRSHDFETVPVLEDSGLTMVSRSLVRYRPVNGEEMIVEAGGTDSAYGLHEVIDTAKEWVDTEQEAMLQASKTVQSRRYPRYLRMPNMTNVCEVSVRDFIPGRLTRIDVDSLCIPITMKLRLQGISVSIAPEATILLDFENT